MTFKDRHVQPTLTRRFLALVLALLPAAGTWGQPAATEDAAADRSRPYGMIEVGGSGLKYVALRASAAGGRLKIDLLGRKEVQTSAGLLKDGKLAPARIKDTARELAVIYYNQLRATHHIPANRIRLVFSSAFIDVPNLSDLETEIRASIGNPSSHEVVPPPGVSPTPADALAFDRISVADELAFLVRGLGGDERGRSVLVDIGSGNVKCGYFVEEGAATLPRFHVLLTGPYGTKRLAGEVKQLNAGKPAADFLAALETTGTANVGVPLQDCAEANAGLLNREKYYLLGGTVWAFSTLTHPEGFADPGELVTIKADDVARYAKIVAAPGPEGKLRFPEIDLSSVDAAVRPKADAEVRRVFEVFTPEQLAAGAVILKNVVDSLDLTDKRKTLLTLRNSQFTWSTAFLTTIAERELLPR